MNRAPARYLGWMVRDFARRPGAVMLGTLALATFVFAKLQVMVQGGALDNQQLLRSFLGQIAFPFILLATGGIVSTDRDAGYYRVIFSKPVRAGTHYLIRWLLGAAAMALVVPLATLGVSIARGPVPFDPTLLIKLMLEYLLLGGTVFVCSTLIRWDWQVALTLYAVEFGLSAFAEAGGPLSGVPALLALILPPFHQAGVTSPMPSVGGLVHILAYGAALVAAALLVLQYRPMGSGGRT